VGRGVNEVGGMEVAARVYLLLAGEKQPSAASPGMKEQKLNK
jgi:hypothetical protein